MDTVIVLGYPFAEALGADISASEGQVNAVREEGRIPLFQLDANVNPGNSGGPLLNDKGEVVGIVVSKLNAIEVLRQTGTIPERVNFAIPIDEARGLARRAYPLSFTPSARTDKLLAQDVVNVAKNATVLILATSDRAPTPATENPRQPEVRTFVENFVRQSCSSASMPADSFCAAFYAPQVNYMEEGNVVREKVARECHG